MSELLDRAAAVGLQRDETSYVQQRYGVDVVQSCITAVNKGLPPAVVAYLVRTCSPALLDLAVAVIVDRQSLGPLGGWSAAVEKAVDDPYGGLQLARVYADKVFPTLATRYTELYAEPHTLLVTPR